MQRSRSRPFGIALLITLLLAVSVVAVAPVARAGDDLAIRSVVVDLGAHHIVVNGVNLTRTNRPTTVVLRGSPLSVVNAVPTQIVAALPIDIQPGDCRLFVSTADGGRFWHEG